MAGTVRRSVKRTAPRMRRKNLILDQAKIDRAKGILGAKTETETIHRALEAVTDLARFRTEVDTGLDGLLGRGGFTDRFGKTSSSG